MLDLAATGARSYVAERGRGRRNWEGKLDARDAVYANRRRLKGAWSKPLMRKRGELIECSFAHLYEIGGMRRLHLRGRANIHNRVPIHAGGFNLGLIMRQLTGFGKPRLLQGRSGPIFALIWRLWMVISAVASTSTSAGGLSRHFQPRRLAA